MTHYTQTFRVKFLLGTSAMALALTALPISAHAQLVSSGDLVRTTDSIGNPGQITVTNPTATTATIDVLASTVVAEWTQFNVPVGTSLDVTNSSGAATANLLNRVIGGGASDISGTINASDVNLWLINQNGILFGSTSAITANSFVASTLDVSDQDFFDFAEGTDFAANGASTVNFAGSSIAAISSSGGTITTDGTLFFASQALNLSGAYDAGSGRAAFVAASDVHVQFNPGSPLGYTIAGGTTVATQSVNGSVTGAGIEFQMVSAAGVVGALLQVDANLTATTAVPTETGILLQSSGLGVDQPSIFTNGILNSSGALVASVGGDYTATQSLTGSSVNINALGDVAIRNVAATAGNVDVNADDDIDFTAVTSTNNINMTAVGGINGGDLTATNAANLNGGNIILGNTSASSINFSSALDILFDTIDTTNAISLTALAGTIGQTVAGAGDIESDASISLNAATVDTGTLDAGTSISVTASGRAVVDNAVSATTTDITGAVATLNNGTIGTNLMLNATAGDANTSGVITANGNINVDALGAIIAGNLDASGDISVNSNADLTFDGAISAQNILAVASADIALSSGAVLTASASGDSLTLSSGTFTNNSSNTALQTSVDGRFLVYTNDWDDNTLGGLSGDNLYNTTYDPNSSVTLTGDRFVYVRQPTLTIESSDASREYGLANPAPNLTVSGLVNGDTASDALSGSASMNTSATIGSDVGNYDFTVNVASLLSSIGYNLASDNITHTLTVDPATLRVTSNDATRMRALSLGLFTLLLPRRHLMWGLMPLTALGHPRPTMSLTTHLGR